MFYLSIFGSVVFVYTLHHKKKNNQCTLKRGHFKRKVMFHPLFFRGHVSFPWSKLPSLPFARLVCVCVISLHHQSFITGYDFISLERIPTNRFCFFPFLFGRLCSIFLAFWALSQHCGASNNMLFFSKFFWWCSYIHLAKPLYRRRHLPGVLNILVPVQRQFGWEAAELGPRERLKGSKTLSEIV